MKTLKTARHAREQEKKRRFQRLVQELAHAASKTERKPTKAETS